MVLILQKAFNDNSNVNMNINAQQAILNAYITNNSSGINIHI